MPDGENMKHLRQIVSAKFGYTYIFGNSLCSYGIFSRKAELYNDSITNMLNIKNGMGWREQSDSEFRRLFNAQEKIRQILSETENISNLPKSFPENIKSGRLSFWIDETENQNSYIVTVFTWLKDSAHHWNILYTLSVNQNTKSIKVIGKKIKPLQ